LLFSRQVKVEVQASFIRREDGIYFQYVLKKISIGHRAKKFRRQKNRTFNYLKMKRNSWLDKKRTCTGRCGTTGENPLSKTEGRVPFFELFCRKFYTVNECVVSGSRRGKLPKIIAVA
jgi:hypothetical protein